MKVRNIGMLAVLGAAVALTGCKSITGQQATYGYIPEQPEEVYPIDVVNGSVKLELSASRGRLSTSDEKAVRRFAAEAAGVPAPVIVSRPARSLNAELVAASVTGLLKEHGVAAQRIRHVTRKGRKGGVIVTYRRKFAVTRECGDWSKSVTETGANRPYRNFGCAQQHNLAAMAANPEDFETPRAMTPPAADKTVESLDRLYRKRTVSSSGEPIMDAGIQ
ncbi:MAG TPA: hypothetical protein ENK13_02895 [Thermopetrobacter sp.]|nr:hypothetical protein [Thermopetrobacter sp.]